jgi:hypothetical protein
LNVEASCGQFSHLASESKSKQEGSGWGGRESFSLIKTSWEEGCGGNHGNKDSYAEEMLEGDLRMGMGEG